MANAHLYHSLFLNFVLNAERRSPGSSLPFIISLISDLSATQIGNRVSEELVWKTLQTYVGNGTIFKLVKEVIEKTGFEQKLVFSMQNRDDIDIDIQSSEDVECDIDLIFGETHVNLSQAIVICFDGIIETVSEIDSLLAWSHENCRPVVLLSRGYMPDVSNTMKKNYKLKKTWVLPFVYRTKETTSIDMSEFSRNHGFSMVSTDTGVRFSNLSYSDIDPVKKAMIDGTNLSIEALSSNKKTVYVHIPERLKATAGIIEDRIKCAMLVTKAAAKFGVCKVKASGIDRFVPNNSILNAKKLKSSWKNMIENTGCTVLIGLD